MTVLAEEQGNGGRKQPIAIGYWGMELFCVVSAAGEVSIFRRSLFFFGTPLFYERVRRVLLP
ncbi:MAG: hypothetical protein D6820_01380 [Lentisphaerae bacterium]|nr:MAG: hypothetical protein D6820_01380 [Lentisphaerota bacterium]